MGRKAKYLTKESKLAANRRNAKTFYERHKERLKKRRMERYWANKK